MMKVEKKELAPEEIELIKDKNTRFVLRMGKKITLVLLIPKSPTAIIMDSRYKTEESAILFEKKFKELRGNF